MDNAIVVYIEDREDAHMLRDAIVAVIDGIKSVDVSTGMFELISVNKSEAPEAMLAANSVRVHVRGVIEPEIRYREDDDEDVIRELPDPVPLH